jgi:hypothetical protein
MRTSTRLPWLALAMLVVGLWLVVANDAGEIDAVYGFASGDGSAPTMLFVTKLQFVGAALIYLATIVVAGVVGRRLTAWRAPSADY